MTTTVKVTYTAQGSPDTIMTFDLTAIDIESIKKELPSKKKELDSKFNVDPQKSSIRIDDTSIKDLDYRLEWFVYKKLLIDIICSSVSQPHNPVVGYPNGILVHILAAV